MAISAGANVGERHEKVDQMGDAAPELSKKALENALREIKQQVFETPPVPTFAAPPIIAATIPAARTGIFRAKD